AAELVPAPGQRDDAPALCLPCLSRRPRTAFGQRLRAYRLAWNLSRLGLAQRSGVSQEAVRGLERGAHRPRTETLRKLAEALGIGPGELLPGREAEEPESWRCVTWRYWPCRCPWPWRATSCSGSWSPSTPASGCTARRCTTRRGCRPTFSARRGQPWGRYSPG